MQTIERHAPGSFSWFQLATTDQAAAKQFYSQLFGWSAVDSPMGPDQVYTMFQLAGRDTAGGYTLREEMRTQGVPPHWQIYIAVESADECAAKIGSFGGKLMCQPFDVMSYGRMVVAADPTGAIFCVWQPRSHAGSGIMSADGTVCWADLVTKDPEAASLFCSGVFGWELYRAPGDPSGYLHIKNGEAHIGGIPPARAMAPGAPPHWMLYFSASNVDAATEKASSLGAKTLVPVMDIPNAGRFSIVQDPQGAAFALFEPAHMRQG